MTPKPGRFGFVGELEFVLVDSSKQACEVPWRSRTFSKRKAHLKN